MRPVRRAPGAFRDIPFGLGAGVELIGFAPGMEELLALRAIGFPNRALGQMGEEVIPEIVRHGKSHDPESRGCLAVVKC